MNSESKSLWISVAAGLFAAFLLYSYSQEKKAEFEKVYGQKKKIVKAVVDIPEMQTIDDTMIEVSELPVDFIQPGGLARIESVVGQVAAAPIKKGEQILQTKILPPGPETGIALQVSPGRRAITLPVDEIRGVAKLIRPGDRIDIYAALDTGKGLNQRKEVSVILQDTIVLATGVSVMNNLPRTFEVDGNTKDIKQTVYIGDTKYTTITIEVAPKDAQDLVYILSSSPGNLFYTLRNPHDRSVPPRLPSSTAESVLGKPIVSFDANNTNPQPASVLVPQAAPIQPSYTVPSQPRNQQNSVPTQLPKKNNSSFKDL